MEEQAQNPNPNLLQTQAQNLSPTPSAVSGTATTNVPTTNSPAVQIQTGTLNPISSDTSVLPEKKNKKWFVWAAVILVALILIGGAAYLIFK